MLSVLTQCRSIGGSMASNIYYKYGMASVVCLAVGSPVWAEPSLDRWTGVHIGGDLGYHDVAIRGSFDNVEPAGPFNLKNIGAEGLHAGVRAGFDWQWKSLVVGLEADSSWGAFNESYTTTQDGISDGGLLSYPLVGDLDYLASVRARIGLAGLISPNLFLYATGGVGFTKFRMDVADGRGEVEFDAKGLVFGAGAEMALTERWSLGAEYLHYEFGEDRDIADAAASGVFDANDGDFIELDDVETVRVSLRFKIAP